MARKRKCWKKITSPEEPRYEITKVGTKYEVYHEPSGAISKLTEKQLLKGGFTKKQLLGTKKETTYFKMVKCKR